MIEERTSGAAWGSTPDNTNASLTGYGAVAKALHWVIVALVAALFYFLLIAGPVLGWASASAHRLPVTVFGLFTLPDIAAPRARWALTAGDIHKVAMWTLLALIVLHVAATLHHHFVRRDRVLQRMLPESRG